MNSRGDCNAAGSQTSNVGPGLTKDEEDKLESLLAKAGLIHLKAKFINQKVSRTMLLCMFARKA